MVSQYKPSLEELPEYIQEIIGQAIAHINSKDDVVEIRDGVMSTIVGTRSKYIEAFEHAVKLTLKYHINNKE